MYADDAVHSIQGRIQDFFRGVGCTRLLLYFNANKPHSFFLQNTSCIRKPQGISGGGGGGVRTPCTLPLDPPLVLICTVSTSVELQAILARDFNWICDWYNENKLAINVKKTKLMLARSKTMLSLFDGVDLQMNGTQVERAKSCKYFGVTMDEKWSWMVFACLCFRESFICMIIRLALRILTA